ncbi:hypothetical protein LCGC14_1259180, partial [marine sediment metagenome]
MQKEMDHIMKMIEDGKGRVSAADVVRSIEIDPELRRTNYAVAKQSLRAAGKLYAHNARAEDGKRIHELVAGRNPSKTG